ncbi:hypothetical protein FACS18942_10540 [Planctomycetales bacterium]|nr:hypothetical protein FACS18942_10540 [Planctomycetales bacterium]
MEYFNELNRFDNSEFVTLCADAAAETDRRLKKRKRKRELVFDGNTVEWDSGEVKLTNNSLDILKALWNERNTD